VDLDSLSIGPVNGGFLLASLTIILIDILLSGDNSVVIAMAVHSLPPAKRLKGILIGTTGAVLLRILFTWFASNLIQTPFLKLVGGILILWIAIKLLIEDAEKGPDGAKKAATLWHAVWMILVADFTMSLDNVLAVAGASKGNMALLWLSLGLSIPLVIFSSAILSRLMNRFPLIVGVGAALLGKVGGEMIFTDPAIIGWFHLEESKLLRYVFEALCVAFVLGVAFKLRRNTARRREAAAPTEAGSQGGAPPPSAETSATEPPAAP
jgi:YjbE family integral membrane protein